MLLTIIVTILVVVSMIILILFKPSISFKKFNLDTFFIPPLVGALLLIVFNKVPLNYLIDVFTTNNSVNPLKILILFIAISMLSITLDELGFFRYIAYFAIKKCKLNQYSLLFALYFLISFLTIFTSNDIVILTFTPFICYLSKNAKINPLPFLIMEFVNANTYSMLLPIGNPTNIYITSFFNINFIEYIRIMVLPTFFTGLFSLAILLLLFHKMLAIPMSFINLKEEKIVNYPLTIISLIHLIITTLLLIVSNYLELEMWLICLTSALSLTIFICLFCFRKKETLLLTNVYKRLPYTLIPFIISMFIIVLALNYNGITNTLSHSLEYLCINEPTTIVSFLGISTICDNLINNIPMSVFFSEILNNIEGLNVKAIYATVIGSNVGAYLTPIGALAGIMWTSLLKKYEIKFNFMSFVKYGLIIVPIALLGAFLGLLIV